MVNLKNAMIKKTIYCGSPAYLSVKYDQLVIQHREDTKPDTLIPIEDIGYLELDNPLITLSIPLLNKLLAENCAVGICDSSHIPSGLLLPLSGHSLHTERIRPQIETSLPIKKRMWQTTIKQKIKNQSAVLSKYDKSHERVFSKIDKVMSGDSTNQEGQAASLYWKALFGKSFIRDRDGEYPNNLLNYGYAVLRAIIARAIVSTGLHPAIGIHHKNRANPFCLADDVMEPFRPFVDDIVYSIWLENPSATILDRNHKQVLLNIPVIDTIIDDERRPLMNAASITASSIWKCFVGESKSPIYPQFT